MLEPCVPVYESLVEGGPELAAQIAGPVVAGALLVNQVLPNKGEGSIFFFTVMQLSDISINHLISRGEKIIDCIKFLRGNFTKLFIILGKYRENISKLMNHESLQKYIYLIY